MSKKINSLILVILISIQPAMSYSQEGDHGVIAHYIMKIVATAIPVVIVVGISTWLQKMMMGPDRKFSSISVKEKLKDYAGTVPQAVTDLICQLKNLKKYREMNVPITKGILLYGDPGCGKTHLARVIAGEAECPFFETNATSFSQNFVGNARSIVENIFTSARAAARKHISKMAIIFVDEFDSIGSRDHNNHAFVNTEIINTLLNEMDGFNNKNEEHIVVIAATNHINNLDSAIIRSGRFDQKIHIAIPNAEDMTKIVAYYLQQCPHDEDVNADLLVDATKGMTPADIKVLCREAGLDAIKRNKEKRDKQSFVFACFTMQKLKRDQQIGSRVQRKQYIEKIILENNELSALSIEGFLNCTECMTLNDVRRIFTLAHDYAQKKKTDMSCDMIAVASCVIEDSIKKFDVLSKINIVQKIYQIDEEAIRKKWNNDAAFLDLTSSMVILEECQKLSNK